MVNHRASAELGQLLVVGEAVGVEVAELVDPLRARRRARTRTAPRRRVVDASRPRPTRPASTRRAVGGRAASTRTPSSCAGRSGSSRRTPCPPRWSFAMVDGDPLRVARLEQLPERERERLGGRRRRPPAGCGPTGAGPSRPTSSPPRCSPSWSSRSRRSSATRQQSTTSSPGAGVEVDHDRGRVARGRRRGPGGCAARARRGWRATRARAGRRRAPALPASASSGHGVAPSRGGGPGSASRRTARPSTPSGARTSVGGRPARWGSITGAIRR